MRRSETLQNPNEAKLYLSLQLGNLEREVFCCPFLDNRHRVIAFEKLFLGTIDGTSVHAREVVKAALKCNAAAVIFARNHPSGVAEHFDYLPGSDWLRLAVCLQAGNAYERIALVAKR